MEPDRFKQNHGAYIFGLICLFLSIGLFAFSLFLLPYLFFSMQYNVPFFVIEFSTILQEQYEISSSGVAWVICFVLDFPAVILFVIADVLSNRIDKQIYGIQNHKETSNQTQSVRHVDAAETRNLVIRILLLLLVVFIVARFFNWVISSKI